LADHFARIGKFNKAIQIIDDVIDEEQCKDPDLLYMKAKVYKRSGDLKRASDIIHNAWKLEHINRFFATKAAKYHLRVHEFKETNQLIILFGIDSIKN